MGPLYGHLDFSIQSPTLTPNTIFWCTIFLFLTDDAISLEEHPDPRYSTVLILNQSKLSQEQQDSENTEVVYDEPHTNPWENPSSSSGGPIFDDPGYDESFKSEATISELHNPNHANNKHVYQYLERPVDVGKTNTGATGDHDSEEIAAKEPKGPGKKTCANSIQWLDEELEELDPDIASCLMVSKV